MDKEMVNPEVQTELPRPEKGNKKRRLSVKAVLITALIVLLIIGGIVLGVFISRWRNDGTRYAQKLAEQIGVSPSTAEKYAHVKLAETSKFACINMAGKEYPHLYESKKTITVSGVSVPEWVIFLSETNDTVTQVEYYNYKQLQSFGNGVRTRIHIEPDGITPGMSQEAVQTYVGFAPLKTTSTSKGVTEVYKYYYKDQNTGNTVSYLLYVTYQNGTAAGAEEEENYFILSVLTLK